MWVKIAASRLLVALGLLSVSVTSVSAALVTVEVDGQNFTSANAALNGADRIQISYSYNSPPQNTCNTTCNDALLDLQVHVYSSSDDSIGLHWNLGAFTNNNGQSTGQLSVNATRLQLQATEAIAGTALGAGTPASMLLRLDGNFNSQVPTQLPAANAATVCLGAANDPCADTQMSFTPQFFQRALDLQWANPLPQGDTVNDILWNDAQQQYLAVGFNGGVMSSSNGIAWAIQGRISMQYDHDPAGNQRVDVIPPYAIFDDIFAVAYHNRYVIAGKHFLGVSRNGIDWIYHSRPQDIFSDVTWDAGGHFIAAGISNGSTTTLAKSTDATAASWDFFTPTQPSQLSKPIQISRLVAGTDSRFYALDKNNSEILLASSSTLQNWNSAFRNSNQTVFNNLVWSNGSAFVLGNSSYINSGTGTAWSALQFMTDPQTSFNAITSNNGSWVAVGGSGACNVVVSFQSSMTPQAHPWNGCDATHPAPTLLSVTNDTRQYLASSNKGQFYVKAAADSLDTAWREVGQSQHTNDLHAASFSSSNNSFYIVGDNGYFAKSANQGVDWTTINSGTTSVLNSVANDQGVTPLLVAVGASGNIVYYLDDGISNAGQVTQGSANLNDVAWVGDQFIAVGTGNSVYSSSDGAAWADVAATIPELNSATYDFNAVYWNGNSVFILGGNGSQTVLLSLDQTQAAPTWVADSSGVFSQFSQLYAMAWSGGQYVITGVGPSQDLILSADAVNWHAASSTSNVNDSPIHRVVWTGRQFLGIGTFSNILNIPYPRWFQSGDGMTWSKTRAPLMTNALSDLYPLAISDTALVTGGGNGSMRYQLTNFPLANHAPSVTLAADISAEGGSSLTIDASAMDSDGSIAAHRWALVETYPAGLNVSVNNTSASLNLLLPNVPTALRVKKENATIKLRYTASDNLGAQTSSDTVVSVTPSNRAPVVNSITVSPGNTIIEGQSVTLDASAVDPDGDVLTTHSWSVVPSNTTIASNQWPDLSACNSDRCQFTQPGVDQAGTLAVTYQTTDLFGAVGEQSVILGIQQNQPPSLTMLSDVSVEEGRSITLAGSQASDDGGHLRFQWKLDPNGPESSINNGGIVNPLELQPVFVAPKYNGASSNIYRYVLTVTDDFNASVSDTVNITVMPASAALNIPQAIALQSTTPYKAGSEITLAADTSVYSDPSKYIFEWFYAGSDSTTVELPPIELQPLLPEKAVFVAPIRDISYNMSFTLKVTDTSQATAVSATDTITLSIIANSAKIDGIIANIRVFESGTTTPISGNPITLAGDQPFDMKAENIRFLSGNQTISVSTGQHYFQWKILGYEVGGIDLNSASVAFPNIPGVSQRNKIVRLLLCDYYQEICRTLDTTLVIDSGGFAGPDQTIDANTKNVTLQFNTEGRKTLVAGESVQWEQVSPAAPTANLKNVNSASTSFSTAGLSKGEYRFKLSYLSDRITIPETDEVSVFVTADIPEYKPQPPKSSGGAASHYLLLLLLGLLCLRVKDGRPTRIIRRREAGKT